MSIDIRRRPEGALLRTYLAAAGLGPDSLSKPMIGVATAATQMFSERPDARDLGAAATSGIEAAGGIAVRWDTSRSPDQMAWGHAESYSFAWRDQLADFIESWAQQQALDGLVLVGDAPETLAGMAMAAARLNLPAIVVTTGARRWELTEENATGKKKKIQGAFELLTDALFKNSKKPGVTPENIDYFRECVLSSDDHSAYAIDLALEALGACLPGMATAPAQSAKRHELAFQSGQRVIQLVKTKAQFRRTLSGNAFANAIRLDAALGGSVSAAVHLMAIAHEAGVSLNLDTFSKIAHETPQLVRLGGVTEKEPYHMEDLDRAGGVWAVLGALKGSINPTNTISGKGAMELAKTTNIKDTHVVMAKRPIRKQSGVGVLHGNLAPLGAAYLLNQIPNEFTEIRGPVHIFENEISAAQAVSDGKLKKGGVVVVRGQGPKGGPGLPILRILPALLESKNLNHSVAVITDGRLPDAPEGLFISLVSPEGAAQGPLAVLRDGDDVEISIPTQSISVRLTDTELRVRYARWQSPETNTKRGFLDRYSRSVSGVSEGAILK